MYKVDFYGYTIHSDGSIINRHGRELKQRVNNGRKEIRLVVNGVRKNFMVSRLVYCAFNNIDIFKLNKDKCVTFRDDDKLNVNLSNLKLVDRANLIQGEKHKSINKLTDREVKEIRHRYELTKHNKPVNQHDSNKPYNSYRSLAEEYGVTHAMIRLIIKGKSRNKLNYVL